MQWADDRLVLRKMDGQFEQGMDIQEVMSEGGMDIMNYDDIKKIKFMDEEEYCEWSGLIAANQLDMSNQLASATFA